MLVATVRLTQAENDTYELSSNAKEKYVLNQSTIQYYGHMFNQQGVSVQPKHVKAISDYSLSPHKRQRYAVFYPQPHTAPALFII